MILSRQWECIAKLWRSAPAFQRFSLMQTIISLHKLTSFSLEFLFKHIPIMSNSDSEFYKYSILMMTVIFKVLTWPIFKRFCCRCHNGQAEYKLAMVELATWSNLNFKKSRKNTASGFFGVADMYVTISCIMTIW